MNNTLEPSSPQENTTISIRIWPGDSFIDKLETIGTCYRAIDDLMAGEDLQAQQKDNVVILMGLLGEIHQAIIESMHRARQATEDSHD
jgi:hypothetical protein